MVWEAVAVRVCGSRNAVWAGVAGGEGGGGGLGDVECGYELVSQDGGEEV